MVTPDLIEYIKIQLNKNITKDLVVSSLLGVGWRMEDIEEGFLQIEPVEIIQPKVEEEKEIKKNVDIYREPPDGTELPIKKEEVKNSPKSSLDLLKVWVPTSIKPVIIEEPKVEEVKKEEIKIEKVEEVKEIKIEEIKKQEPEIKREPAKEAIVDSKEVEVFNLELEGKVKETIPVIKPITGMVIPQKKEEPKIIPTSFIPPLASKISTTPIPTAIPTNAMPDIVSKNAMLASYSKDILSATVKEEKSKTPPSSKKWILKLGILLIVLSLVGGMVFAFVEGYIKLPWSKLSFLVVKKDPKIMILNAPSTISNLKSYKVDTSISISSPSLSNITTGLSSGEVVNSKEEDSISINAKGLVNHVADKTVFDYIFNLKSSLLENEIISNWKSDGQNLSIGVPDLTQILGGEAPVPTTVSLNRNQLGLIVPELSGKMQELIKKVDIYNILSSEVPPYVKGETFAILKEFIGTLEYVNKGKESIHGIETYHYEVTATRPATKKFLSSLVGLFSLQFTDDEKKNLDEALGASSISSFEVWVGQNDDNLYQFKFTLNTPLSRVLWLNDSGIAGGEVKLDWISTYYDLNIPNNVVIPSDQTINMEQFINNIKDIKIKNIISSFKSDTTIFKNAVGSYGKKINTEGSCTNPLSESLFSPLGHIKGADTAVSSISSSMSSLLLLTKGEGYCFSTSKAWALSVPLNTIPLSFYCTDSEGITTTLLLPITGTVCSNPVLPVVSPTPTPTPSQSPVTTLAPIPSTPPTHVGPPIPSAPPIAPKAN